jgi:hypothetical protein
VKRKEEEEEAGSHCPHYHFDNQPITVIITSTIITKD